MAIHRLGAFGGVVACVALASACWCSRALGGTADLTYVTPNGWAWPIVVSTFPGTNVDSPNNPKYTSNDVLYVDIAVINSGTADAGPFYVRLLVDGALPAGSDGIFRVAGLAPGATWTMEDINHGQ